ncbi:MAG TPA: hypothetical protein VGC76_08010 [Pyrinomonadaceae bacterium]|jgi:hypothetical protein
MSSYELDKYFPLKGTCFHCGRDARHWLLDEIKERFSGGESVTALSVEFDVPGQAIELVLRQYSSPLGITFNSTLRTRAAAA